MITTTTSVTTIVMLLLMMMMGIGTTMIDRCSMLLGWWLWMIRWCNVAVIIIILIAVAIVR